jgi:LPXTG-motif cell wall-anchored protein
MGVDVNLPRRVAMLAATPMLAAAMTVVLPGPAHAAGPAADLEAVSGRQIHVWPDSVGQLIRVYPALVNHGPATPDRGAVVAHFVAPGGTELVVDYTQAANCHEVTAGREMWCYWTAILPPTTDPYEWGVQLRLLSTHVTPGRFWLYCACDPNLANNSAPVTFIMEGVTPEPGASSTPPAPQPADNGVHTSGRRPTGNQTTHQTTQTTLPVTGANVGIATAAGITTMALGAFLLVVTRRRRTILVTPADDGCRDE